MIAELDRQETCRITELLDDHDFCLEAAQNARALIGEIIPTPGEKRGKVTAVLNGAIIEILEFAAGRRSVPFRSKVTPTVLARPRNHEQARQLIELAGFRLSSASTFSPGPESDRNHSGGKSNALQ